ncbi:hypothetical protein KSC_016730 [Ktedonobacter sp. SOSP1-52]|nr:hypothetical protein KSC_016730 [Ktedonobacter sp. SOSP1-52]
MVIVFHELSLRYQHALHLQRVHEAVLTLTQVIAHLPERIPQHIADVRPEGSLLRVKQRTRALYHSCWS